MDELYLIKLFCHMDDFWKNFKPKWEERQVVNMARKCWWSTREPALSSNEIMTICVCSLCKRALKEKYQESLL